MGGNDLAAITNVVNLYAVALDAHRYERFADIFSDDIRCDFGGGAAFTDRASLIAAFRTIHAGFSATQHIVSGHAVTRDGDAAHCLSYVHALFLRDIDNANAVFESTGWYDDRLIRTPHGWRIAERTSRMVTARGDLRVMQAMPGVDTHYTLLSLADEAAAGRVRFFDAPGSPA